MAILNKYKLKEIYLPKNLLVQYMTHQKNIMETNANRA